MIKTKVAAAASTETPEEKAAREAEQARAEAQQIDETQGLLQSDTRRRARRFGVLGSNPFAIGGGSSSGALNLTPTGSTLPTSSMFSSPTARPTGARGKPFALVE